MAPPQAVAGVVWAMVGPPLIAYAATRVRRGRLRLHAALMIVWVVVELGVFVSFTFLMQPSSRRPALIALPIFKIHLAFAVATLAGIAWQLTSRAVPTLRPLHHLTGPCVALVWCVALLTGIFNYVFLYVMRAP